MQIIRSLFKNLSAILIVFAILTAAFFSSSPVQAAASELILNSDPSIHMEQVGPQTYRISATTESTSITHFRLAFFDESPILLDPYEESKEHDRPWLGAVVFYPANNMSNVVIRLTDDDGKVVRYAVFKLDSTAAPNNDAQTSQAPKDDKGTTFTDVPSSHWAYDSISQMVQRGVINGYTDGTFHPDRIVTRSELAKIMVLAAGINPRSTSNSSFSDIVPSDWFSAYVEAAKPYLTGYSQADGSLYYAPNAPALREDMAIAIVKLKGYETSGDQADLNELSDKFTDYDHISQVARKYISVATAKGLVTGYPDNTFRPQEPITRAQAAALLDRAFQFGNANKVELPADTSHSGTVTDATYGKNAEPDITQTIAGERVPPVVLGAGAEWLSDLRIIQSDDIVNTRHVHSGGYTDIVLDASHFRKTTFDTKYTIQDKRSISGYWGLSDESSPGTELTLQIWSGSQLLAEVGTIHDPNTYLPFDVDVSSTQTIMFRFIFKGDSTAKIEPVLRNAVVVSK